MATFTATTYGTGDDLRHVTDVNGRHLLVTDEPESIGGTNEGPAPHELLPAMLSACIATMLSLYARRCGLDIGDIRVDVDYDTATTPRRLDVTVCMPPGFPDDDLGRLMRVVQSCPVKQAFEAGFVISENVEMPALD